MLQEAWIRAVVGASMQAALRFLFHYAIFTGLHVNRSSVITTSHYELGAPITVRRARLPVLDTLKPKR